MLGLSPDFIYLFIYSITKLLLSRLFIFLNYPPFCFCFFFHLIFFFTCILIFFLTFTQTQKYFLNFIIFSSFSLHKKQISKKSHFIYSLLFFSFIYLFILFVFFSFLFFSNYSPFFNSWVPPRRQLSFHSDKPTLRRDNLQGAEADLSKAQAALKSLEVEQRSLPQAAVRASLAELMPVLRNEIQTRRAQLEQQRTAMQREALDLQRNLGDKANPQNRLAAVGTVHAQATSQLQGSVRQLAEIEGLGGNNKFIIICCTNLFHYGQLVILVTLECVSHQARS